MDRVGHDDVDACWAWPAGTTDLSQEYRFLRTDELSCSLSSHYQHSVHSTVADALAPTLNEQINK